MSVVEGKQNGNDGNGDDKKNKISSALKYRDGSKLIQALKILRKSVIKPQKKSSHKLDKKEWKEYLPGNNHKRLYDDKVLKKQLHDENIVLGLPENIHSTTNHNSNVISKLETRRRVRHDNEWAQFIEWKNSLNRELEENVFHMSQNHRKTMIVIENNVSSGFSKLLTNEYLIEMDANAFHEIWQNAQQIFEKRTKQINEFKDKLYNIECERRQRFGTTVERLVDRLVEIAYLLRDDIERLLECECNEMNTMLIRNHSAIDECILKMNAYECKLRDGYHEMWQRQREEWCRLRYEKLMKDVINEITTNNEWINPMDRSIVYDQVMNEQTLIYNESMNQIQMLIAMQPPILSRENVDTIHKRIMNLNLRFNQMCDKCINELTKCNQSQIQRYDVRLQLLSTQLSLYRICSTDDERLMIEQRIQSIVNKQKNENIQILDRISYILQMEEFNLHRKSQLIVDIYSRASMIWEAFIHELDQFENLCTDELDGRRDVYTDDIQRLERKLKLCIDHMQSAPSIERLNEIYDNDLCPLLNVNNNGEMESVHLQFYNESIGIVSNHTKKFTQFIEKHSEILLNFVGIYANHQLNQQENALDRALHPHLYDNDDRNEIDNDKVNNKKLESPPSKKSDDELSNNNNENTTVYGPAYDAIELGYVHKSASQKLYVVKSTINQQFNEWMNSMKQQKQAIENNGHTNNYDEYVKIYELDPNLMIDGLMNLRQSFVNRIEEIESVEGERIRQTSAHRIQLLTEELDLVLRKHRPRISRIMTSIKYKRQCELTEKLEMFHRHWDRIKHLCATMENEIKTSISSIQMIMQQTNDEIGILQNSLTNAQSMSALQQIYNRYQNTMKLCNQQMEMKMRNEIEPLFNEFCVNGRQMMKQHNYTTDNEDDDKYRKELIVISQQFELCIESQSKSIETIVQLIKQFPLQCTFESTYNHHKEYLSFYNGLGHQYGAPKRYLSTHLRNEYVQNNHLLNQIEEWCQSLETIINNNDNDHYDNSITTKCILTLWKLRRMFYRRGYYLELLNNDNVDVNIPQISLMEGDNEQLLENGECKSQQTYDTTIESIDATCRTQMYQLVEQYYNNSKQREKPNPLNIPLPIQQHFDKEKLNALMKYKQFAARYRDLVARTTYICDRLPKILMNHILCTSKEHLNDALSELNETFDKRIIEWKDQHRHSEFMLKPYLSNPLMKKTLNDLMENEEKVHEATIDFITEYRENVLKTLRLCVNRFIKRIHHTSTTLILLFDSIVTLHHLKSKKGDDKQQDEDEIIRNDKRRSGLKRLIRKSNRVQRHQNKVKESSSSSKSSKKVASPSSSTVNRFEKCQYAELNISELTSLLDHKSRNDENSTTNDCMMKSISMIECSMNESNRFVIIQRNRAYELYKEYFTNSINQMMNRIDTEKHEELKWRENWKDLTQNLIIQTDDK